MLSNDVVTQAQGARIGIGVALLLCFLGDTDACRSPIVRAVMDNFVAVFAKDRG